MKKTKLLLASLFFLLLGIAFSCKVDLEDLQEPTINSDLLNNLRQSFEQSAKTDPFLKTAKIDPAWNNAIVFENSVELPFGENGVVHRPSLTTDNGNTGRERLILTQKNGKLKTYIIRYMPSKEYKGKIHEINLHNLKANRFSGKVAVQILGSKKIRIYSFANGKSYKQYKGKIVKIDKKGRVAACYEEGFYECTTKYDEHGEWYMDCIHKWITICDDEDEGDDEEDPDICEIIPSLCEQDPCLMNPANCNPCDGNPNGRMADCGGPDSNGDGIPDIVTDKIKDKPCFNDRVKEVINNSSSNDVNQIVKGYISMSNPRVTFNFVDESVTVDANTRTLPPGNFNYIDLNPIGLEKADRAYLIATIYHEFIHVYLPGDNNADHVTMLIADGNGKTWVDKLAEVISQLSGVPLADAQAMAAFGVRPLTSAEETLNNNHKFSNPNTNNNNGNCN